MGRIFDAIEKFNKENKASAAKAQGFKVVAPGPQERQEIVIGQTEKLPPSIADKLNGNLVTVFRPKSFEAEQFKMLRTNLLFPGSGVPPHSIMITSALPGEGKSFVASNLAVSIAQNINEHVLLMDCDIRRPTIHRHFGFSDPPGLSEYLSDATDLASLLLKTGINKLTILPAGKPPDNPAELLSSEKMAALLAEVKKRYKDRYILIDSPPPQLTAETKAMAKNVDGILLVVKYGDTRRELVAELVQTLGKEKIIGIVMNWLDMRASRYYGYSKHSKYYSGSNHS